MFEATYDTNLFCIDWKNYQIGTDTEEVIKFCGSIEQTATDFIMKIKLFDQNDLLQTFTHQEPDHKSGWQYFGFHVKSTITSAGITTTE